MSAVKNLSIRLAAVGGDKVRQEFKNLGTDGDKAFRRITQVIQPANDNLKALDATARSFNEVIRQGTALFGAYLGLQGLKNTFSAIFSANTSFEQLSGSLKTVTGSAKGAQEAFSLIEKFAIDTPYQLNEIVEAFIQLKALGLEPSEAALVSYGNTASAFGKNIKDFVGAVAAATVGEFERLKTFGIKAKVINDDVSFTFAGVTTKVKKNAAEIEKYLRTLGDVNFAGAMNEQMKTMNGVLSNIEDSFEKIYRDIGKNGLNEALKSTFTQFNELVESGGSAAKTIGQTLAVAVNTASSAFFLLAEHADVALTLIGTRLGSSAILGGIKIGNILGQELQNRGFNVVHRENVFTQTHQIFIEMPQESMTTLFNNAVKEGITLNTKKKPLFHGGFGIRLGLQEISRYKWNNKALSTIADILGALRERLTSSIKMYKKFVER